MKPRDLQASLRRLPSMFGFNQVPGTDGYETLEVSTFVERLSLMDDHEDVFGFVGHVVVCAQFARDAELIFDAFDVDDSKAMTLQELRDGLKDVNMSHWREGKIEDILVHVFRQLGKKAQAEELQLFRLDWVYAMTGYVG